MKNNPFFRKHKFAKEVLITLFIFSIIINISDLVGGYMEGDIIKIYKKSCENREALNNPKKYLENAIFAVDTVFLYRSSSRGSNEEIIIRGYLLHSKEKQELSRNYYRDYYDNNGIVDPNDEILNDTSYHLIDGKKVTLLKVLKNKINNTAFLTDKESLRSAKSNAVMTLYTPFVSILLLMILLILKIKSR